MNVASAILLLAIGALLQHKGRKKQNKKHLLLGTVITTVATIYLIANLVLISAPK